MQENKQTQVFSFIISGVQRTTCIHTMRPCWRMRHRLATLVYILLCFPLKELFAKELATNALDTKS